MYLPVIWLSIICALSKGKTNATGNFMKKQQPLLMSIGFKKKLFDCYKKLSNNCHLAPPKY